MVNYNVGQSFLLGGVESTFNTAVTTNKSLGIIGSLSPSLNNNIVDVRGIGDRESQALLAGNFDASLSIDGTLNSGAIFEMFFGQCTDETSTSDYRHWFVDVDDNNGAGALNVINTATSYTISENYDSSADVTMTYAGCAMNNITVNIATGEALTFTSEVLAADVDTGTTAGTKVTTATTPLTFANCVLKAGAVDSEATLGQVSNFSITLDNGIDYADIRGIGSRVSQGAVPKQLMVSGEFTMKFQDKTQAELFLGGTAASTSTPTAIGIIFDANNGVSIGNGRVDLYIRLNGAQYESLGRTTNTDNVVEETFSYKATTVEEFYFTDAVATYF